MAGYEDDNTQRMMKQRRDASAMPTMTIIGSGAALKSCCCPRDENVRAAAEAVSREEE